MPRSSIRVSASAELDNVQQPDIWKVDDVWKEVSSKEEKKRRQNRINQRAYRRRNPTTEKPSKQRPFRVERFRVPDSSVSKARLDGAYVPTRTKTSSHAQDKVEILPSAHSQGSNHIERLEAEALQTSLDDIRGTLGNLISTSALAPWTEGRVADFSPGNLSESGRFHSRDLDGQALFRISIEQLISPLSFGNAVLNANATPINSNSFPLSSDHLLHLIHFNVFRGLITNKSILSGGTLQTKIHLDIALPDSRNLCDGLTLIRSKPGEIIPTSLNPTYVQASIAHSSWFNMFPFPAIRDNLIKAEQDFNHEDLCLDLFGEMFFNGGQETVSKKAWVVDDKLEDDVTARRKGLILWGEPWDMDAWEVTPGFVNKWAWTLKDCPEMIDSTNRWRLKRDEKPLAYPSAFILEEW